MKKKKYKYDCCFCKIKSMINGNGPISRNFTNTQTYFNDKYKCEFPYHLTCYYLTQGKVMAPSSERLSKAYLKQGSIKCQYCGKKGAFINCQHPSCLNSYHLTCIEDLGSSNSAVKSINSGMYQFYCPRHRTNAMCKKSKAISNSRCGFC